MPVFHLVASVKTPAITMSLIAPPAKTPNSFETREASLFPRFDTTEKCGISQVKTFECDLK